ncbi:hypothetical protein EWW49_28045, partial [Pseudomonas syringae]
MLHALDAASRDALSARGMQESVRGTISWDMPAAQSEAAALAASKATASKEQLFKAYNGHGYCITHTAAPVLSNLLEHAVG